MEMRVRRSMGKVVGKGARGRREGTGFGRRGTGRVETNRRTRRDDLMSRKKGMFAGYVDGWETMGGIGHIEHVA